MTETTPTPEPTQVPTPPPAPTDDAAPPTDDAAPPGRSLSGAAAVLLAWLVQAGLDAIWIAALSLPAGGLRVRALHHLYAAGHAAALGLALGLVVLVASPLVRGRRWFGALGVMLLGGLFGLLVLPDDLEGLSERLVSPGRAEIAAQVLATGLGSGLLLVYAVGRAFARPRWRWLAVGAAVVAGIAHERVLDQGYPGLHFLMVAAATTLFASALAGGLRPASMPRRRRLRRGLLAVGLLALAALAVGSLTLRPPNAVRLEMFRLDGAVLAHELGRHDTGRPVTGKVQIPPALKPWFSPRTDAKSTPPTQPALLPAGSGVVLLVTIDSLRHDVFRDETNRARLPHLFGLRDAAVDFVKARSPGSGTRITLGTVFSGKYFSQLRWTGPQANRPRLEADKTKRFPELLRARGVRTVTLVSEAEALVNKVGILKGFAEEKIIPPPKGQTWPLSDAMVDAAIGTLRSHGTGPLFLYMHLMDAHVPYDAVTTKGDDDARWMAELTLVDTHVGRLMAYLDESGLAARTALIVTADHGEALGEHDTPTHNATLYEELVRVPLFIRTPGVKPRRVEHWVQLTDLGPTILDLLGAPTPGSHMGVTLLPYVRGQNPPYTRPLVSERRYGYAVVLPGDFKVIVDWKKGTQEIYDLKVDPRELNDLRDDLGVGADARLLLAGEVIDWLRRSTPGANGNQRTPGWLEEQARKKAKLTRAPGAGKTNAKPGAAPSKSAAPPTRHPTAGHFVLPPPGAPTAALGKVPPPPPPPPRPKAPETEPPPARPGIPVRPAVRRGP